MGKERILEALLEASRGNSLKFKELIGEELHEKAQERIEKMNENIRNDIVGSV